MSVDLWQGDCLAVMRSLPSESIAMVAVDPPFNLGYSQKNAKSGIFYEDSKNEKDYIEWLTQAMLEVRRLLKPNGTVYVHLNERISYKIRFLVMDRVFGESNWLSTVIWSFDYGGRSKKNWPHKHEPILMYAKDAKNYVFNYEDIDRIPYMAPNLVGSEKAARGKCPTTVWWQTIVPTQSKDRVHYPTQKPVPIYKRMIIASSNVGDTVLDFCCGSSTTAIAAHEAGRNAIMIDSSPQAISVSSSRFEKAGVAYTIKTIE